LLVKSVSSLVWLLAGVLGLGTLGVRVLPGWSAEDHELIHKGPSATPKLAPAEGAKVEILVPKKDQVFTQQKVPISYKMVRGKRGSHVHAYVDGKLVGMFAGNTGTLSDLKPGAHLLEFRVVASDHQTELDARDIVRFYIKK
jgi:hypothetical protein